MTTARRQLEDEFAEFVTERADQIRADKERVETPHQRQTTPDEADELARRLQRAAKVARGEALWMSAEDIRGEQ